MYICSEHGEDIAHSGRDCPACSEIEDIKDEYKVEVDDLQTEIDRLQDHIDEMRTE